MWLARNNKSGAVQSDARLGSSDEPVQALARRTGQQGSDRARQPAAQWRFAMKQTPVLGSRPVRWGQFPPGREEQSVSAETKERDEHR